MSDSQTPEFETDNGFLELIQPRDEKYMEELEEDIFDHGCRDAVCVWGNTLIDGHLRYSICKKWDIRFNIRRLIFQSRDEAEAYLCAEQLKRTDLTSEYKKYLIGRLFRADMNAASAAFFKEHPEKQPNADGQISQKYVQKTEIATIIGKEYNFGFSTVTKYDVYARALDEIRAKGPEITNRILNGNLRVSHENVIELSRLPIEDINGLKRLLESGSIDRIGYSQLRHAVEHRRYLQRPDEHSEPARVAAAFRHGGQADQRIFCIGGLIAHNKKRLLHFRLKRCATASFVIRAGVPVPAPHSAPSNRRPCGYFLPRERVVRLWEGFKKRLGLCR